MIIFLENLKLVDQYLHWLIKSFYLFLKLQRTMKIAIRIEKNHNVPPCSQNWAWFGFSQLIRLWFGAPSDKKSHRRAPDKIQRAAPWSLFVGSHKLPISIVLVANVYSNLSNLQNKWIWPESYIIALRAIKYSLLYSIIW